MRISKIKTVVLLSVIALVVASCSFSQNKSKTLYNDAASKSYDAIVVPGVPFENGEWSQTMKGRVLWSKYLYDRGIAKNIIYSGSAVYSPYIEAEIMAEYAKALGIPAVNVFTETKAEHSTENIYYSYHLAKKLGFSTVALASDPFQTKMLKKMVKKHMGTEVGLIPIVFDSLASMEERHWDIKIDYHSLLINDFTSITERESFRKRFRGTRGKNIDFAAYN